MKDSNFRNLDMHADDVPQFLLLQYISEAIQPIDFDVQPCFNSKDIERVYITMLTDAIVEASLAVNTPIKFENERHYIHYRDEWRVIITRTYTDFWNNCARKMGLKYVCPDPYNLSNFLDYPPNK